MGCHEILEPNIIIRSRGKPLDEFVASVRSTRSARGRPRTLLERGQREESEGQLDHRKKEIFKRSVQSQFFVLPSFACNL